MGEWMAWMFKEDESSRDVENRIDSLFKSQGFFQGANVQAGNHYGIAMLASPVMATGYADGVYVTVLGHLDNRKALHAGLGLGSSTELSESELVGKSYRRWGAGAVKRVYGANGVVLWDRVRQQLVVGADCSGYYPVYWTVIPQGIVLSSSAQILYETQSGLTNRGMERTAVGRWLQGQLGEFETILSGIHRLPEGTAIIVDHETWINDIPASTTSVDPIPSRRRFAIDALEDKLTQSIRSQGQHPVPASQGFWADGTTHSLLLAAMAVREGVADGPLYVSHDYGQQPFLTGAQLAAKHLGLKIVEVDSGWQPGAVEWAIATLPEPYAASTLFRILPLLANWPRAEGHLWIASGHETLFPIDKRQTASSLAAFERGGHAWTAREIGLMGALAEARGMTIKAPFASSDIRTWLKQFPPTWHRDRWNKPSVWSQLAHRYLPPAAIRLALPPAMLMLNEPMRAWAGDILSSQEMRDRGVWKMSALWEYFHSLTEADPVHPGFMNVLVAERWMQQRASQSSGLREKERRYARG